jgi:hypothetical protein
MMFVSATLVASLDGVALTPGLTTVGNPIFCSQAAPEAPMPLTP